MSIPVITPRERFLAAFSHTETDRVPVFESMANASLFPHYLGRENRYCDGGPMVEISRLLGLDAAIVYDLGYTSLIHRELD